jgi:hypothetical protein
VPAILFLPASVDFRVEMIICERLLKKIPHLCEESFNFVCHLVLTSRHFEMAKHIAK